VCGEDKPLLAAIERLINRQIEQRIVAGFEPGQSFHAPARQPERGTHQRQGRRQQPAAQPHHRKGGNHQQPNRQGHRHEPRPPVHGQHAGQQPRQHSQQPAQPRQRVHRGDGQPAPQRAQTQQFPALFGTFGRKTG